MKRLLLCSALLASMTSFAADDTMSSLKNTLNLANNQAYDLMSPGKDDKKFCLSIGTLKGYMNSMSSMANELDNASEVHSNLKNFECSITQAQTYCDKEWKSYLSDCDSKFKKVPSNLKAAKKLVRGIIQEADNAFSTVR